MAQWLDCQPEEEEETPTQTKNKKGEYVPAIPEPLDVFPFIKQCLECWRKNEYPRDFWTMEGYRGHYALKHILQL